MPQINLIDLEVDLPPDVLATEGQPQSCVAFYRLEGPSVQAVRKRIEAAGVTLGYDLQRTITTSSLLRGEQRITLVEVDQTRLDVTADDPDRLPFARTTDIGIALGRFSIALDVARIVPRRERHDVSSAEWIGEWEIFEINALDISRMILDGLVASGLSSGGTLAPKNAGIGDTWHSEAYNPDTLMKVRATQEHDRVLLRLELIDTLVAVPNGDTQEA